MEPERGIFAQFLVATAVLTRVPVGIAPPRHGEVARAAWAFAPVGAGIGGVAAAAWVAAALLGCGAAVSALLALLAAIAATGALHEDGLADTADGFGGGRDRAERLRIMRDSRHGTYGVLALVLSLALRGAALAALGDALHAALALIAAHAGSRALLAPAMRALSPARADGLGAAAGTPSRPRTAVALAGGTAIALGCLGPTQGAAALALAALAVAAAAALARRQIGGYTGDVLGAFQQVGEIVMLLVAAAR